MAFLWFGRRPKNVIVVQEKPAPRFTVFAGQRRLANNPYILPKDLTEVKRLDFQHFVLKYGIHGNYLAPISQPTAILDVGCGTGRWAMEMARDFPGAKVYGLDVVAAEDFTIGYGLQYKPQNYTFLEGDALKPLPFPDNTFDFTHQRLLIGAVPMGKWPEIIQELKRVTRPGGWIELAECGVPRDEPGKPYPQLWSTWIDFSKSRNVDFTMGSSIGQLLRNGQLAQVKQHEIIFPMGNYGGHIGLMSATDCLAMGRTMKNPVITKGIIDEKTYDTLYNATEQEFNMKIGKGVLPFYIAYAQKPL